MPISPRKHDAQELDEQFVCRAVGQAHPNALRVALLQATGDVDLVRMKLERRPIWGGAYHDLVLSDMDIGLLRSQAVEFLLSGRDSINPVPNDAALRQLMDAFSGAPVDDFTFSMGKEELGFREFPRGVDWIKEPPEVVKASFPVLIVGAGAAGLTAAVLLTRLGIPFTIIDRNADIGGTWFSNRYPGLRVDTASHNYQLSLMRGYPWAHHFALQPELHAYLSGIADEFGLRNHIRLRTELVAARWDEAASSWCATVRTPNGAQESIAARAIISAAGLFNQPNLPDILGINEYQGRIIHSSAWDETYQWAGKRIAVIGVGSTGAQLMPVLAQKAASVAVFQRSPQWVGRRDGYQDRISDETQWLFRHMPHYRNWYCFNMFHAFSDVEGLQNYDREWLAQGGMVSQRNDALRAELEAYIRGKVGHRPELVAKLIPDFPPLAKRLIADNGWYDALLQPNVELVTTGIDHIVADGIVTKDQTHRVFDLIVVCAGFKTAHYLSPTQYVGRDGRPLEKAWAEDGARAYLGMAVPGFPNFFMNYGPNGQARAGGVMPWLEICARYAVEAIARMIESDVISMDCREDVYDEYNRRMDLALKNCIWDAPVAKSYYINEHGRQNTNMPWLPQDYYCWTRHPNFSDYELRHHFRSTM